MPQGRDSGSDRLFTGLSPTNRKAAAWSASVLLALGVAAFIIWIVVVLRAATVPFVLALLGTALLQPLMPWLMKRGASRALASGLTCAGLVVLVCGALVGVIHSLTESAGEIADGLAEAGDELAEHLGPVGDKLQSAVNGMSDAGAEVASSAASGLVAGLSLATQALATLVLALALALVFLFLFLFLRDGNRGEAFVRHLVPGGQADTAVAIARRAYASLAGYMRGTTLVALIDSLLIFVGLLILDVPGAAGLAALVFMGAYIPFVGAFLSGLVSVLVALAHGGTSTALWALLVVLVVQAIEGNFLQPAIQSRTVSLHPATVMLSVAAGAGIAGVLGALLAVPLSAAGVGVVEELRTRGRRYARRR
ncbi:AI-2E family transporter [Streptomyces sp. NBC_00094]|uniref:AI-2E family transporter n=1 Tax=Streptomyces sp. NBC_00094 TaxID=2903620 RepID=UPI0022522890|nr:AI-2E family transporter [Streptomyces sp. NBC_00094]MCX5389471.1 AI-2E family transporter [Streptomyces sp. NBC_00094]